MKLELTLPLFQKGAGLQSLAQLNRNLSANEGERAERFTPPDADKAAMSILIRSQLPQYRREHRYWIFSISLSS